ncbi:MAG: class I SAM-dependent methyltransferase, partial [Hyphomonadaceae bacterium]|nr:class I SAM-dependent methyltransferase [Hyphomonadaceae bacterium]
MQVMPDQIVPSGEVKTSLRATSGLIAGLKAPASAKAVLLALLQLRGGSAAITLPDGRMLMFGDRDRPSVDFRIHSYQFARRVLTSGDIGFAEGLMAGEWESQDLSALLTLLASNVERFTRLLEGGPIGKAMHWLRHLSNANTKRGSRRNILAHYDLGNAFYSAWLDASMTYSSARFDAQVRDLEAGQRAKYKALAEHLDLKAGDHVLEIGCGWG